MSDTICVRHAWQVSYGAMKKFEELTEREVLALAIPWKKKTSACMPILQKDYGRIIRVGSYV